MRFLRSASPALPAFRSRPARSRPWYRSTRLCSGRSPASCPTSSSARVGRRCLSLPKNCPTPRLHWLGIALILIMLSMIGLTVAGLYGFLPLSIAVLVALGIFVSFGTGGTFALVPLLFPDRPGIAAGFIGGISTVGGIAYPLIFASVNAHV